MDPIEKPEHACLPIQAELFAGEYEETEIVLLPLQSLVLGMASLQFDVSTQVKRLHLLPWLARIHEEKGNRGASPLLRGRRAFLSGNTATPKIALISEFILGSIVLQTKRGSVVWRILQNHGIDDMLERLVLSIVSELIAKAGLERGRNLRTRFFISFGNCTEGR